MTNRTRILTLSTIAFLLWAIIASATTLYFYRNYTSINQRYNEYYQKYMSIRGSVLTVSITLDYDNGSFNTRQVYLSPNTTAFDALKAMARVNATYWVAYQSFFVEAVNGIANNANNNNRWWVYSVNGVHSLVSADQYKLHDGDNVEWKYEKY